MPVDVKLVNEILENYVFSDIDDEDVKAEICERVACLSDDPEVKIQVGRIDSEHEEGLSIEIREHGVWKEYAIFAEQINGLDPLSYPEEDE